MYTPVSWPAPDLLGRRAAVTPKRTALVDGATGEEWTYRELSDGPVAAVAAGIRAAGLDPGAQLGLLAEPDPRTIVLVHAAARAGVVLVPLPPEGPADLIDRRRGVADLEAIAVPADRSSSVVPDTVETIQVADLRQRGDGAPRHRWQRDDVQWLVFTSGTTGQPTPVRLTAGNLVASATASAFRLGVDPADRWLACLPLHHVGGLSPLVRTVLYGTTVVQQAFDPARTASVMARETVTGVSLVPTMLTRLLEAGWDPPADLRFVLLGGAPASRALIERCESAGVPVCPTYGATETASQIATARPDEAFDSPGTVGRPLRGTRVTVEDGSSDPATGPTVGELVVAGPTVSPGYYGTSGDDEPRFVKGAFRTRDRGYLDDAGRLWVLGRLDDAITTGGETVHPDRVETVLREHPAVVDAAVVGLPDPDWGEIVAGLVEVAADNVDRATLEEHCRRALDPAAVPKRLRTTESLPRTASGTVDRAKVASRLRDRDRRDDL